MRVTRCRPGVEEMPQSRIAPLVSRISFYMADLVLVYGMRLLPADEVTAVESAPVTLRNGNEARVTMHILEGSREQIEAQLRHSLDAFFDFYPEI
jgi:hypothetical protein